MKKDLLSACQRLEQMIAPDAEIVHQGRENLRRETHNKAYELFTKLCAVKRKIRYVIDPDGESQPPTEEEKLASEADHETLYRDYKKALGLPGTSFKEDELSSKTAAETLEESLRKLTFDQEDAFLQSEEGKRLLKEVDEEATKLSTSERDAETNLHQLLHYIKQQTDIQLWVRKELLPLLDKDYSDYPEVRKMLNDITLAQ